MAQNVATQGKGIDWRSDLEGLSHEFTRSLPAQLPTDRFVRTVLNAVQGNPDLALADRRSLKLSCMKAAQDGLLPDGREGALVIYNTKVKTKDKSTGREIEQWVPTVQWMPMVAGLIKKARNSGEIASISAHVVFKRELEEKRFRIVYGDEEMFEHEPLIDMTDDEITEDNAVGAYAIGTLKDGTKVRVWRSKAQIMTAKGQSKAQNSLMWTKFWQEGYIKTAIRYLAKYLPASTDKEGVDTFARTAERDDELYDLDKARDVTPGAAAKGKLQQFVENKQVAAISNGEEQEDYSPAPEEELPDEADHDEDGVVETEDDDDDDEGGPVPPQQPERPVQRTQAKPTRPVRGRKAKTIAVQWPGRHEIHQLTPASALALYRERAPKETEAWRIACGNLNPELDALVTEQGAGTTPEALL